MAFSERKLASTLYFLEDTNRLFKEKEEGIDTLRRFAEMVCRKEQTKSVTITAGHGMLYKGRLFSYCTDNREIVLSRAQRNKVVLLHELAHAFVGGGYGHSARFRNKYFYLLEKYLKRDLVELNKTWAYSLRVKQRTHNSKSVGSTPTGPTN